MKKAIITIISIGVLLTLVNSIAYYNRVGELTTAAFWIQAKPAVFSVITLIIIYFLWWKFRKR